VRFQAQLSQGFYEGSWVRIASSVPPARDSFLFNAPLAGGTLEAMRTQERPSRMEVYDFQTGVLYCLLHSHAFFPRSKKHQREVQAYVRAFKMAHD
jgi:hypothetical protein